MEPRTVLKMRLVRSAWRINMSGTTTSKSFFSWVWDRRDLMASAMLSTFSSRSTLSVTSCNSTASA